MLGAPTAAGIPFEATIPVVDTPGALRDRVDEAWQSIQAGLIRGMSIGYRVLEGAVQQLKGGGLRLLKTEVLELSLVTIPANVEATILSIKSAALGPNPAGAPAALAPPRRGTPMQTTREQITSFENSRASTAARMAAIMTTAGDTGTTLDDGQSAAYDTLDRELKSIDDHLGRLHRLEAVQIAAAALVAPRTNAAAPVISVKSNLPAGTGFVRAAMCLTRAKGNRQDAIEYAKAFRDTPEVELFLKAAIAPGSTTDPAWAGALVTVQNMAAEFVALLRPKTIIGRIPGLRNVPFNASVPVQSAGGSYGWVGQGAPKPVTKLGFGSVTMPITKAAGILVLTEELVRLSSPSAEDVCRADMIAGITAFLDHQFIDPAVAPVANISPGSITNGVTPIPSGGHPILDIAALVDAFSAANVPIAGAALILSESNAFALGVTRAANGAPLFPDVNASGGSAFGMTVVTSAVANGNVILCAPGYILLADDGGVAIDVSREASVQLDSAVAGLTSLWENNLVGLRAERFINWQRAILPAVQYISGADYPPVINGGGLLATPGREHKARG